MNDPSRQIIEILSRCRRVLVTTHVRPDGDSIGTCAAAVLALRQKGIDAEVLLLSRAPQKYAFLFHENGIVCHDAETGGLEPLALDRFEALLVVDTGAWSQLPGMQQKLTGWNRPKLVIDHHLTQENWADVKLVDTTAAAAAQVLAEVLLEWEVRLDKPLATALYLAIVTDTGWFQFSNTRPQTLRLAATLMEAGVDTDRMYQAAYQNERLERIKLATRAQESMQLLAGGRLAVMCLCKKDFEATGANAGDTENLINIPLQISSVAVSMFVIESTAPGPTRISLRSKGQLDVARFAEAFGGGGHARAAGLKLDLPFQEARDRVVAALLDQLAAGSWQQAVTAK
jgi:phosphoesterase RecJ-like protein